MTTLDIEQSDLIEAAWCTDTELVIKLKDGRRVAAPFWWYPRLLNASPVQRAKLEIGRFGLHWGELDEDIELAGLLLGAKAPDARHPDKELQTAE